MGRLSNWSRGGWSFITSPLVFPPSVALGKDWGMFLSKLVPIVFQHHWTGKGGTGEMSRTQICPLKISVHVGSRWRCSSEATDVYLLQDIFPVEVEEMLSGSF